MQPGTAVITNGSIWLNINTILFKLGISSERFHKSMIKKISHIGIMDLWESTCLHEWGPGFSSNKKYENSEKVTNLLMLFFAAITTRIVILTTKPPQAHWDSAKGRESKQGVPYTSVSQPCSQCGAVQPCFLPCAPDPVLPTGVLWFLGIYGKFTKGSNDPRLRKSALYSSPYLPVHTSANRPVQKPSGSNHI